LLRHRALSFAKHTPINKEITGWPAVTHYQNFLAATRLTPASLTSPVFFLIVASVMFDLSLSRWRPSSPGFFMIVLPRPDQRFMRRFKWLG
jgi:hypothetical protein